MRHTLPVLLAFAAACSEVQMVDPLPVHRLDAGVDSLVMSPGESLDVVVRPRDEAGNLLYDRVITLSSSSPGVASIDSAGHLAAVAVGASWLRFTSEEAIDSIPVRVISSWVGGALGDQSYGPGCFLRPDLRAWCFGPPMGGSIPAPRASMVAFREMYGGYMHICGIASDSAGWCWGRADEGAVLHILFQSNSPEPVEQFPGAKLLSLTAGYQHTCAVMLDGTGLCWGHNDAGQVGDSTFSGQLAPDTVYGGHLWKFIGASDHWTCGVDSVDQVWCWGGNESIAVPGHQSPIPVQIPGLPVFTSIKVGGDFACGLTAGGVAWCWGANDQGQLGHPGGPEGGAVVTPILFAQLAVGYDAACGLDAGGAAWCWGSGGYTGDGTWEHSPSPTPVQGDHRFVALASGWPGFCGFTSGGAAWCWGKMNFWNAQALVPRRVIDP